MVEREPCSKALKVKLLDFGFATFFETDKTTVKYVIGTPEYMAPEVIDKQLTHGPEADIWSLGVMTYLLLARQHPFKSRGFVDKKMIQHGEPDFSVLQKFSKEAQSFVQLALTKDPKHRPSAAELLNDPWFQATIKGEHSEINETDMTQTSKQVEPSTSFMVVNHSTASQSGDDQAQQPAQGTIKELINQLLATSE